MAENAADPDSTLVVYMGLSTLPSLAIKLMHHGLPSNTPAVAVERGTTLQQRMVSMKIISLSWVYHILFQDFDQKDNKNVRRGFQFSQTKGCASDIIVRN